MTNFFKNAILSPYDKTRPVQSILKKIIRIFYSSVQSFYSHECNLKASLLTFYSLISIVPVLAIIFAIAKGFGFEDFLQKQMLETFKEQKDILSTSIRFAYAFIGNIKSQAIIGIGIIFLFFSIFGLFENIEKSINTIWNVKKYRGVIRRFLNYLTTLIFFPIVFIASISVTVFINNEILVKFKDYNFFNFISEYDLSILKIIPYILMCLLFAFIYLYTPNSKIYFKSRIFAGVFAGTLFQFWQILYINFQVNISSYNVIYGSFAALPLFLIWMQVNFFILLFGAEIAAQIEADKFFKSNAEGKSFKIINERNLILIVLHKITGHFLEGGEALSIEHISEYLGISLMDARGALNVLERTALISEIRTSQRSIEQYQLIVNPELFKFQEICDLIDRNLMSQARSRDNPSLEAVSACFGKIKKSIENTGLDLNLKDFANLKN